MVVTEKCDRLRYVLPNNRTYCRSALMIRCTTTIMGFLRRVFRRQSAEEITISDDALYERDLVRRMIAEGRDPETDPEFCRYMCLKNARPIEDDRSGEPKYRLVEMPEYIKGRKRMAKRGANLYHLDSVILNLRYGCTPPRNREPREVHGDIEGMMECRIHGRLRSWTLVYRYDDENIVLYALSRKRDRKL